MLRPWLALRGGRSDFPDNRKIKPMSSHYAVPLP
jgi:hypothetical protein